MASVSQPAPRLSAHGAPNSAVLEICARDGQVTRIPLLGRRYVIGRLPEVDIRIPHDTVSRRHAELVQDPFSRWWLRDLGSRFGMRVQGERVNETLLSGDEEVEVGEFLLRIRMPSLSVDRSDVSMPVTLLRDDQGAAVRTLRDTQSPSIAPDQLASLTRLGPELARQADAQQRRKMLCEHFIRGEFRALSAMVLRLPMAATQAPQRLCTTHPPGALDEVEYVSQTLLREVLRLREPVLASNMPTEYAGLDLSLPAAERRLAAAACPLRAGADALEILYVTLPPELGTTPFLALLALAAALYQQAETGWQLHVNRQSFELIERDLERGREIQRRLLPPERAILGLDVAYGVQPCRWVGGDYLDVIPTADGRVLLVLGDVSGKGLAAALTTGNLHALMHAHAGGAVDIGAIVCGANDYLTQVLPDDAFVTLCGVLLDPRTGKLEFANAGHPAPLVVSAGGVRPLPGEVQLPLGLAPQTMAVQTGTLAAGQWLVLYSDGATDLVNEGGTRLDFEGLNDIVRSAGEQTGLRTARQFVQYLEERLDQFQGRALPADDRTLLVARRAS